MQIFMEVNLNLNTGVVEQFWAMMVHSFKESKIIMSDNIIIEFKKYLFGYKNSRASDAAERPNSDGTKGKMPLAV
jgi:hypothetical protein